MNYLDYALVALYAVFLVSLGVYLNRRQKNLEDYYLGGRKVKWWASGLSTMATQLGAVSFVSAPAFVALKSVEDGGGLVLLAFEFAVPLALLFIMIFLLPAFHRAGVASIYEYLRERFDPSTQAYIALLFQVSRGLATGVTLYAVGFVVAVFFGEPDPERVWPYIVVIGVITIFYDTLGGIRAVIWSDVIQMGILGLGIFALLGFAAAEAGGFGAVLQQFQGEPERFRILDPRWGYGAGQDFSFWPMLLGGFFLYIAYYGCDQSQVQRELSVGKVDDVKRSLMLNVFARFPLVLCYCAMGLSIGAVALKTPEFLAQIPPGRPDYMVPIFIMNYLPHGLIGLLFIAVLAAGMSSLDSALNSMSASTMRDIYQPHFKPRATERHYLIASKVFTLGWGVFAVAFAFAAPLISGTVLEVINKVGSLLYGPIFAAFFLGVLTRWATPLGVKAGTTAGILLNLYLWLGVPELSWLWWNVFGMAASVGVAAILSRIYPGGKGWLLPEIGGSGPVNWPVRYALVVAYFFGIILFCYWLQSAALV